MIYLPHQLRVLGRVSAGFATPAEENLIDTISLDSYLIRNKDASFMMKVQGDAMKEAGILDGDLVVIELATEARQGMLLIVEIDGVWRLQCKATTGKAHTIKGIVRGVVRKYA